MDFFVQISVDVLTFGLGHLGNSVFFGFKNLDFLLTKIEFLSCFIDIVFQLIEESHETDLVVALL